MKLKLIILAVLMSWGAHAQVKKYKKWVEAVEVSKKENKDILIILTGKEWCAPCKKLENSILKTNRFKEYADAKFIIFEIDVPKSHLLKTNSSIVRMQEEFSTKYKATAFPSLILVNQEGVERMKITESNWEIEDVLKSFEMIYNND